MGSSVSHFLHPFYPTLENFIETIPLSNEGLPQIFQLQAHHRNPGIMPGISLLTHGPVRDSGVE